MFGNPPFVTEKTPIGSSVPPQITRANLFSYVESELLAIEPLLMKPQSVYGRADQGADWALLSRLYLNAKVYTGTDRSTDCMTYAAKVIGTSGYSLMPTYRNLFLADNNLNNPEVILPIEYDGVNTQNYGGTTFIINSSISAAMGPSSYGMPSGGWAGNHTTQALPTIFGDYSGNTDHRAWFYTTGCTENTTDESTFTAGFAITKFSNLTSTGTLLPQADGVFASTDFPLFRLGEVYLNYIEAALRSGTNTGQALSYFNLLRDRAYGNASGELASISLTDVLNERSKELYWEATRRTDLIRFGMFTGGTYLWAFKGGVEAGTSIPDYRALYPLPSSDVTANPNLKQNTGY
jgi:starch-binding outer membrane protein, SusD/RagB family